MATALLKLTDVQLGVSPTATNNFTWYQPATPDGTVRLGNGNSGSTTDVLTLNSSGNLGLGVAPPTISTGKSISVGFSGSSIWSATGSGNIFILSNTYYNGGYKYDISGKEASYYQQNSGIHSWYTAPSGTAGAAVTFTNSMTLDASGNLGIGATSAGARLLVNGGGLPTSGNGLSISSNLSATRLTTDPNGNTSFVGGYFDSTALEISQGSTAAYISGIVIAARSAFNSTVSDAIALFTHGAERMRLDGSGNVGIGTSSPSQRLHVKSTSAGNTAQFEGPGASDSFINITNTGVSNTFVGFNNSGSTNTYGIPTGVSYFANGNGYPIAFSTNANERMRIDSSGNLLVGQTAQTSTEKLGVTNTGDTYVAYFKGGSTGQYSVGILNPTTTGNALFQSFLTEGGAGTLRGSITYNRGAGLVAYNTSSDYRLKENIVDLPNALDTVSKIKPRQFDWKETGNTTTGFIAHELAEILPHAVTGEKDAVDAEGKPVYQGIDTSFLVATLTAAIQEQQAIIESLTARVAQLEGK